MDWSRVLNLTFLTNVLAAGVGLATPMVLAALGEVLAERSGVFNLGLEGIMLLCGFTGFAVAFGSHSLWLGVAAAAVAGALVGLLFAVVSVSLRANQVVAGFAVLILCSGAAQYFNRLLFPSSQAVAQIESFPTVPVPRLASVPFLGKILFSHSLLTYAVLLLVPLTALILARTRFGLRVTAVGEYPRAADAVGVNVTFIRYACVIAGGLCAGVAGAYFSLVDLGLYVDSMVSGRGYIALALVVFGQWNPFAVLGGGVLFGAVEAIQSRLQFLGAPIPSQFMIMLPYVLTIVVLLAGRKRRPPAALTIPYARE